MTVLTSLLVALVSCVAGLAATVILRFFRAERKKPIQVAATATLLQFGVTFVGLAVLPWEDGRGHDEYRGPLFLIGSFLVFTLFHILFAASQLVRKEPNQTAQTTPGLRPSVSDL